MNDMKYSAKTHIEKTANKVQTLIDALPDDERIDMGGTPGTLYLSLEEESDVIRRFTEHEDNVLIGFLDIYSTDDIGRANIVLAVHPDYRGRSIATKLTSRAKEWIESTTAKEEGINAITWFAKKDNVPSVLLAQRHDFVLMENYENDPEWWGGVIYRVDVMA